MLILDGLLYFVLGTFMSANLFGHVPVIPVIVGLVSAVVLTRILRLPFIGRVMQIITGILWVYAAQAVIEHLTFSHDTGRGIVSAFIESSSVYYSALLIGASAVSVWLQLKYVGDSHGHGFLDRLFMFFHGFRREGQRYSGSFSYGGDRTDSEEIMERELDKYHKCFDRIRDLVDEITRCEAFRYGGDIVLDAIAASMSFIQDNNSEVERLCAGFPDEDEEERERILCYLFGVNGKMLENEDALKAAYSELKEQYKEYAYTHSREERSRSRRQGPNGAFEPDPRVSMFFNGCDTRDKLDRRYKGLAKTYHPDMESGDTETMALINREYERLKEIIKV